MESKAAGSREEHVLLVEADESARDSFCELMALGEITVRCAGTVAAALKLLHEEPSLVVLSFNVPDGSSLEVLGRLRDMKLNCTVVLLSDGNSPHQLNAAQMYKPDAIFTRPLDPVAFVEWVCLDQTRARLAAMKTAQKTAALPITSQVTPIQPTIAQPTKKNGSVTH